MLNDTSTSPIEKRYASKEMSYLFSPQFKFSTWRRLWVALAEAQKALGLPISDEQLKEMEQNVETIDFLRAHEQEKGDVAAHALAFGQQCPKAEAIIHLGASSTFVTINTDLVQIREGLKLVQEKLVSLINELVCFCEKHASQPCLAYSEQQPVLPTTVGKRGAFWIQDLLFDLKELLYRCENIPFFGGAQISFLTLFDGDEKKVKALDEMVAKKMGFSHTVPLSGEIYSHKLNAFTLDLLSGIATSAHRFATDIQFFHQAREMQEPHEEKEALSERISALCRLLFTLVENPRFLTAMHSQDDPANRRLVLSEAFLAADGILNLLLKSVQELVVHPEVVEKRLLDELPLLAIDTILIEALKKGGERRPLHEAIQRHAQEGKENLLKRLAADPAIPLNEDEIHKLLLVERFIGPAENQLKEYLANEVKPVLQQLH